MHPQALAQSATLALSAGTAAVSAAVGAITLAIAWFAHHKLAHRHRILDLLAKILMAAGATILFASPGARLLQGINTWSAGLLRDAARATQLTSNWPSSVGILTLIEIPLLLWAALHLWDAVQGRRAARSRTGAGSGPAAITAGPGAAAGRSGGKSWQWIEHRFEKYGAIGVGPLTVTLPGPAGAMAAVPFAALAAEIGHLVGSWFGLG